MWKFIVVTLLVIQQVDTAAACPEECFCTESKMTCDKVKLNEHDLTSLEIPSQITELVLRENQLDAITEHSLVNMRHLESLEILKNQISKIPIFAFRGFSKLRKLVINENRIDELTEGSFIGLENLMYLELQQNEVSRLQPGVFDKLKSIFSIRMEDNQIQSIDDGVFTPLTTLRHLFLTRNKITKLDGSAFKNMKMIRLGLASNGIEEIHESTFEGFDISTKILFLKNPLDCSCKNAMRYKMNFQHLQSKLWGYCQAPLHFQIYHTLITNAHQELAECSLCDLNPCRNKGKCTGDKNEFKCTCTERYKGDQCQVNICRGISVGSGGVIDPDSIPLKQINHTEVVIVKEQVDNEDDAKKLKILYAMCSFEFIVIICFVIYFMWKRYEEWKLQKQYEHEKSRAILFSIRNQTNAQLAKALVEENEEFPAELKSMILNGSVPV